MLKMAGSISYRMGSKVIGKHGTYLIKKEWEIVEMELFLLQTLLREVIRYYKNRFCYL